MIRIDTSSNWVVQSTTPYTEQGCHRVHVRPWHNFARILQTEAEPGPSHFGFGCHNCAVGVARIYLTRRSARPNRLSHTGGGRRRDPLRWDLGIPPLSVSTEARESAELDTARAGPLSRKRLKNLSLRRSERESPMPKL